MADHVRQQPQRTPLDTHNHLFIHATMRRLSNLLVVVNPRISALWVGGVPGSVHAAALVAPRGVHSSSVSEGPALPELASLDASREHAQPAVTADLWGAISVGAPEAPPGAPLFQNRDGLRHDDGR